MRTVSREPELERPFRALGYPWLPLAVTSLDIAVFFAIVWYDPMSGLITVGSPIVVAVAWSAIAILRKNHSPAIS